MALEATAAAAAARRAVAAARRAARRGSDRKCCAAEFLDVSAERRDRRRANTDPHAGVAAAVADFAAIPGCALDGRQWEYICRFAAAAVA